MANNDSAAYVIRFNEVSQLLEYAVNGNWVSITSIGGGINQLTGDVTAGPGTGSQVATISNGAITAANIDSEASTNGQVLTSDGAGAATWVSPSAGTPAGNDTEVQFNNAGAFGASTGLTWVGNALNVNNLGGGSSFNLNATNSSFLAFNNNDITVTYSFFQAGNDVFGSTQLHLNTGATFQVNNTAGTVEPSALVEVVSTVQGFLPPRMTTAQKNAIAAPAAGLIVFDTDLAKLCVYSGVAWETITSV